MIENYISQEYVYNGTNTQLLSYRDREFFAMLCTLSQGSPVESF
jgi:hypothetical protein